MRPFHFLIAIALFGLAPVSSADFITGRVIDSQGVGIAGIDIDVKNLGGGGDPVIFNDGTDALGFFTTTVPNGLYLITFTPPAPPASTSLIFCVDEVTVTGTLNMGTLTAPQGVALSGHLTGPVGQDVAGVNLDVIVRSTGENIDLANGRSDLFGMISLAVPMGPIEVRFDTTPVVGLTLAPTFMELDLSADTSIGTLQFEQGFVVNALLRKPGGLAVVNADVDVVGPAGTLYTPGDSSDLVGFVDFVVPAGTFNFEICPQFVDQLVAVRISDLVIGGNTSLGILNLQAGVVLSGTVRSHTTAPVAGVNIDLNPSAGGPDILLCSDSTNALGAYALVVPSGTFDVEFSAPFSEPLGLQILTSVVIAGATIVDGTLPACVFATSTGTGRSGSGGVTPTLVAMTAPRLGNPSYSLSLSGGLGGAPAVIFAVLTRGTRTGLVVGQRVGPIGLVTLAGGRGAAGTGSLSSSFPIPADDTLVGEQIVAWAMVFDPGAFNSLAFTPTIVATICP